MSTSTNDINAAVITPQTRPSRPPKPSKPHPSIIALSQFLSSLPPTTPPPPPPPPLPSKLRYDIYGALLLLPPTSPLANPPWDTFISTLPPPAQQSLYKSLADSLKVTHIAINAPIPAKSSDTGNPIRAPQIQPLYGTFGDPSSEDFESVFWASTLQHGIYQTWVPLHTMFSRGNITEKARVYDMVVDQMRGDKKGKTAAVDLFVGIGYFAFSYLKGGIDVVYGWDINRWSIEGCRRGAVGNKWGVKIATADGYDVGGEERLVVFQENNEYAPTRLKKIKEETKAAGKEWAHIVHVNLGLLPTSEGAYKTALQVISLNDSTKEDSWVHVHENAAKDDVDVMKEGIVKRFKELAVDVGMDVAEIECEHVEFVKSWAPGVWHCVFDVKVSRAG